MLFSLAHEHKHELKKNKHVRFSWAYAYALMRLCLCLCASENSIRQISAFVLLMFLLMLTLMSRVFPLVMLFVGLAITASGIGTLNYLKGNTLALRTDITCILC